MPVKFQGASITIASNLTASRLREILWEDVYPLSEKRLSVRCKTETYFMSISNWLIEAECRIYSSEQHTNIVSDNGSCSQAIICTNAAIFSIKP